MTENPTRVTTEVPFGKGTIRLATSFDRTERQGYYLAPEGMSFLCDVCEGNITQVTTQIPDKYLSEHRTYILLPEEATKRIMSERDPHKREAVITELMELNGWEKQTWFYDTREETRKITIAGRHPWGHTIEEKAKLPHTKRIWTIKQDEEKHWLTSNFLEPFDLPRQLVPTIFYLNEPDISIEREESKYRVMFFPDDHQGNMASQWLKDNLLEDKYVSVREDNPKRNRQGIWLVEKDNFFSCKDYLSLRFGANMLLNDRPDGSKDVTILANRALHPFIIGKNQEHIDKLFEMLPAEVVHINEIGEFSQ